ncbi:hypothetical protein [uncultured Pseudomonas sp.]|uniref:hypothetical protein n=1 Tax=uncultured Pseudomonas sp. TaxID=114707 RepID=UPI0025D185BF|nr:hypothetical protein [uncultured Pseudomonas sp.]
MSNIDIGRLITVKDKLEAARAGALLRLSTDYAHAIGLITQGYPGVETQSWTRQASDARRHLVWVEAGSQGDAPATELLSAIWSARAAGGISETMTELSQKVLAKDGQYSAVVGTLTGRRHAAEALIEAADSLSDLNSITWDFSLG